MATVYLAHDDELERSVALKLLPPSFGQDRTLVKRFKREFSTCAKLNHPNIIRLFDFDCAADGIYFYTMEVLKGRDLDEYLLINGELPAEKVIEIITSLASALATVHKNEIIHRDIKPSNIFLRDEGHVVLTDFGLVYDPESTRLTKTEDFIGTPRYASPEMLTTNQLSAASDYYQLALVAYELLTNQEAFPSSSISELYAKIIHDDVKPPSHISPELARWDKFFKKTLAKSPNQRARTSEEFIAALPGENHETADVTPIFPSPKPKVISQDKRWSLLPIFILSLIVFSILMFYLGTDKKEAHQSTKTVRTVTKRYFKRDILPALKRLKGKELERFIKKTNNLRIELSKHRLTKNYASQKEKANKVLVETIDDLALTSNKQLLLKNELPSIARQNLPGSQVAKDLLPLRYVEASLWEQDGLTPPWGLICKELGFTAKPRNSPLFHPIVAEKDLIKEVQGVTQWQWLQSEEVHKKIFDSELSTQVWKDTFRSLINKYELRDSLKEVLPQWHKTPTKVRISLELSHDPQEKYLLNILLKVFDRELVLKASINGRGPIHFVQSYLYVVQGQAKVSLKPHELYCPLDNKFLKKGENEIVLSLSQLPGVTPWAAVAVGRVRILQVNNESAN